jgi:hypothetical protein
MLSNANRTSSDATTRELPSKSLTQGPLLGPHLQPQQNPPEQPHTPPAVGRVEIDGVAEGGVGAARTGRVDWCQARIGVCRGGVCAVSRDRWSVGVRWGGRLPWLTSRVPGLASGRRRSEPVCVVDSMVWVAVTKPRWRKERQKENSGNPLYNAQPFPLSVLDEFVNF